MHPQEHLKQFIKKNKNVSCVIADHWKSLELIKSNKKKICLIHSKEINHKKGSGLNNRVLNVLNNVDYVISNSNFTKNLATEIGVNPEKISKQDKTLAELTEKEKNSISHRSAAIHAAAYKCITCTKCLSKFNKRTDFKIKYICYAFYYS